MKKSMIRFLLKTFAIVLLGGLAVFLENWPVTLGLHAPLRWLVATGSAACAGLLGLPTYLDGTTVHSLNYSVAVIPACGGLSGTVLVLATAAMFSVAWKQRLKLALIGVVLIYAFNVVRVATVLVVGTRSLGGADFLHDVGFPALWTVAFATLWFYWLLREAPAPEPAVQA
jgi:exosortase/archaeosortase family protein